MNLQYTLSLYTHSAESDQQVTCPKKQKQNITQCSEQMCNSVKDIIIKITIIPPNQSASNDAHS